MPRESMHTLFCVIVPKWIDTPKEFGDFIPQLKSLQVASISKFDLKIIVVMRINQLLTFSWVKEQLKVGIFKDFIL